MLLQICREKGVETPETTKRATGNGPGKVDVVMWLYNWVGEVKEHELRLRCVRTTGPFDYHESQCNSDFQLTIPYLTFIGYML